MLKANENYFTTFFPQWSPAPVGFDPSTGELFVNGHRFLRNDFAAAVASVAALDKPEVPMPPNFRPISPEVWKRYYARAKNHMERPVTAFFIDVKDKIQNSLKRWGQANIQQQRRIEAEVRACYAIADIRYPLDSDEQSRDADACIESKFGAR